MLMPGPAAAQKRMESWASFQSNDANQVASASTREDKAVAATPETWEFHRFRRFVTFENRQRRSYRVQLNHLVTMSPSQRSRIASGGLRNRRPDIVGLGHRVAEVGGLLATLNPLEMQGGPGHAGAAPLSDAVEEDGADEGSPAGWVEHEKRSIQDRLQRMVRMREALEVEAKEAMMEQVLHGKDGGAWFGPLQPGLNLPSWVDWRLAGAVAPVQDQGTCGRCGCRHACAQKMCPGDLEKKK